MTKDLTGSNTAFADADVFKGRNSRADFASVLKECFTGAVGDTNLVANDDKLKDKYHTLYLQFSSVDAPKLVANWVKMYNNRSYFWLLW